jgi:pSer/pThr/pTyr-binding forkhead associated (FHA) protein
MHAEMNVLPDYQAADEPKSRKTASVQRSRMPGTAPVGEAFISQQTAITFEIGNVPLKLPLQEDVIVGRLSNVPTDIPPHVCLDAFGAQKLGVSRLHLKITRKRGLIYVLDMDSRNGTYLNGRRIAHKSPRILRNGDELHLGRLKVKVRFN